MVAQDLRRLLRFTWRGRAFECLTLIFGLSEAPWLFTKVMRAPVRYLRKLGIRVVIYLDDLLFIADSPQLLRTHMQSHWTSSSAWASRPRWPSA